MNSQYFESLVPQGSVTQSSLITEEIISLCKDVPHKIELVPASDPKIGFGSQHLFRKLKFSH